MKTEDINNLYLNTQSQKLYRVSPIKKYIIDKIDNNQRIRRLTRYLTTTPLLNKGMSYDGKMISQPDLQDSLTSVSLCDKTVSTQEVILIPYPFSEEIISEKKVTIYVHSPKTTFGSTARVQRSDVLGRHTFVIEIVYPTDYNVIEPYGQERANLIACEILNELDGCGVSDELRALVGECEFKISGDITSYRLSSTGYMVTTIPITVSFLGVRTELPTMINLV